MKKILLLLPFMIFIASAETITCYQYGNMQNFYTPNDENTIRTIGEDVFPGYQVAAIVEYTASYKNRGKYVRTQVEILKNPKVVSDNGCGGGSEFDTIEEAYEYMKANKEKVLDVKEIKLITE
ncbi:MAG: hypothetical protein JXQ68_02170 [Campylobacterales bacterium]|nr:hypothetical protein [Campylobacterales bacterium]